MASDWLERDSDYLLVEGQPMTELHAPLKRSTRLKYNCVSVSNKLVALGSNTGGIYIFSRTDQKHLQIAFAERETNSVSHVKISPHEKYVAFVSSNSVHVLDLRLESRSKAQTLRSTSDFAGCSVTCLLWDQSSAKLYIGDDMGKVSMMPVYSNKAKNLFSLALEVIMKLDSAIVQLDKSEDKILVSTLSRCYICDTNKQNYSQIGKKLRDGSYGACILTQGTSVPMIYCARPGSRIWEVDFEGNVLNTHQFKQLLDIASSDVVKPDQLMSNLGSQRLHHSPIYQTLLGCFMRKYSVPTSTGSYIAQSVVFPRLVVLRNNFLLTWTTSSVYVLDPINVKVILWTNQFSGIQDVCCIDKDIYIFLQSMELQCLSFHSVTTVIPLYVHANNLESAARMCIYYKNMFLHKHVRKKFGVAELNKVFDGLVTAQIGELADKMHEVIVTVEKKIASESENDGENQRENDSLSSGRSRSSSAMSGGSVNSANSGVGSAAIGTNKTENTSSANDAYTSHVQAGRSIHQNLTESSNNTNGTSAASIDGIENRGNGSEINVNEVIPKNNNVATKNDEKEENAIESLSCENTECVVNDSNDTLDGRIVGTTGDGEAGKQGAGHEGEIHIEIEEMMRNSRDVNKLNDKEKLEQGRRKEVELDLVECQQKNGAHENDLVGYFMEPNSEYVHGELAVSSVSCQNVGKSSENHEEQLVEETETASVVSLAKDIFEVHLDKKSEVQKRQISDVSNLSLPDVSVAMSPVVMATRDADILMEDEDDLGFLPSMGLGQRRVSLNSLSSMDSAEVYFDQPFSNDMDQESGQIAIPVKRKSSKKKHRWSPAQEVSDSKRELHLTRSLSVGRLGSKDSGVSPQGSVHSARDEDSVSMYSNDSVTLEDGNVGYTNISEYKHWTDGLLADRSATSPMSNSGDFTLSEEFSRNEERLQSGELSPGETSLPRSWEKNKLGQATLSSSAPKTALLQLKNKMQTKVTSKTKNLIRNIKEKNLLTKAKEFAENLSQGSEAYLHSGELPFQETPDVHMTHSEFRNDTQNQTNGPQPTDNLEGVDGLEQVVVDCTQLETVTTDTKQYMEDTDLLMDVEAVYRMLSEWITILNKTFQEFHMKKYGHLENNQCSEEIQLSNPSHGVSSDEIKAQGGHCDKSPAHEHIDKSGEFVISSQKVAENSKSQAKPEQKGTEKITNVEIVKKILSDGEFCYMKDPLHLSTDMLKDVSELAQAGFDIGCHGNILMLIDFEYNIEQGKETQTVVKTEEVVVSQHSDTSVVKSDHNSDCENINGNSAADEDQSSNAIDRLDAVESETVPEEEIVEIENCDSQKTHSIDERIDCDKCSVSSLGDVVSQADVRLEELKDDYDKTVHETGHDLHTTEQAKTEHEKMDSILPDVLDNKSECTADEHADKEGVQSKTNTKSCDANYNSVTDVHSVEIHGNTRNNSIQSEFNVKIDEPEESDNESNDEVSSFSISDIETNDEVEDRSMGLFIRCYFPYLSTFRIREDTLTGKCCYHLWSALVTCMEEKSRNHGEKYGIEDKFIIGHLLDSQAHTDLGAILLGHISKLFRKNAGSVVDVCVRCHPFLQPMDVMYLCRYHHVALETVFKQYMMWMTMDETSAIKQEVLEHTGTHIDTGLAWIDILLSEERMSARVVDENGYPRCRAHLVPWKNQALLHQFTNHVHTHEGEVRLREMFTKHGYWVGVLKLLKKAGPRLEHLTLVLQLDDVDLLGGCHSLGYSPLSLKDWKEVLITFMKVSQTGNQTSQEVYSDWSRGITWNSLAVLLVRHIGAAEAVSLLEDFEVPEGVLSTEFYQVCLLSGVVQKQQRLVLHSMLERVDSYLWSQRPTALTPQLQYLAVTEKKLIMGEAAGPQTDLLQTMGNNLKEEERFEPYVEDSECHWGIETKINLLCPCCNIAIKETVSLEEPGILIFRCGHGFHKLCLPGKECPMCDDDFQAGTSNEHI